MEWMDELRGLAILLVILHHVPTVPAVLGGTSPGWTSIMEALAPFRMPLMLALSGMLLPQSVAKPLRTYYTGKVRKILWPFLVWTVLTNLALLSPQSLLSPWTWIGGTWHLWFLAVLLACYLVGSLTRWIPAWAWIIPMVALSPFPDTNAFVRILWFGSFFFFGAALMRHAARWQNLSPAVPLALSIASIGYGVWVATPAGDHRQTSPLAFVASIAGILAVIWIAPRLPRSRQLQRVGQLSMVYYVVHFPAIGVLYLLVGDLSWWVLFPLLAAAGYGVPWLLTRASGTALFQLPNRTVAVGRHSSP